MQPTHPQWDQKHWRNICYVCEIPECCDSFRDRPCTQTETGETALLPFTQVSSPGLVVRGWGSRYNGREGLTLTEHSGTPGTSVGKKCWCKLPPGLLTFEFYFMLAVGTCDLLLCVTRYIINRVSEPLNLLCWFFCNADKINAKFASFLNSQVILRSIRSIYLFFLY